MKGKSGSFEMAGTNGITMKVNWEETYDVELNRSTVSIVSIEVKSSWYYEVVYYLAGTISVDSKAAITMNSSQGTHSVNWSALNQYATVRGVMGGVDVTHEDDGSKSAVISVSVSGYTTSGGAGSGWKVTGSQTVVLTDIPRAATIHNAADVTLGNACSIAWTPASTSFRYQLEFSIGDWSYTTELLHPNTVSSYTYTGYEIPLEVANHITDSPTGTMTATLRTYSDSDGAALVGEDTKEFTVTVPDNEYTKPAVGMELSLVSDLPHPFDSLYIQNLTKVGADIYTEGKYGAAIEMTQLVIGGVSYGDPYVSGYLTQTGDVAVTGKATDSRGYVGKTEQTIHVIPYSKPAIVPADGETDIVCVRCDASGNITDSGTYLKIKAKRIYSQLIHEDVQYNTCAFRYRVSGGAWVTIPSNDDELDTKLSGVVTSTTKAYNIDIGVVDGLGYDAIVSIIVPSDQVEFHLRDGGDGAAFGEYAEEAKVLAVAESWELRVKGKLTVGGNEPLGKNQLLELIYPVGSIYLSANAVSPATFLGGTWERIKDKFLLSSGDTYEAGSTGGEATHTLTESEMPSHTHTFTGEEISHDHSTFYRDPNASTYPAYQSMVDTYATGPSVSGFSPSMSNVTGKNQMRTSTDSMTPAGTNAATGGGAAHNNMPPYLAVYVWQRTA